MDIVGNFSKVKPTREAVRAPPRSAELHFGNATANGEALENRGGSDVEQANHGS